MKKKMRKVALAGVLLALVAFLSVPVFADSVEEPKISNLTIEVEGETPFKVNEVRDVTFRFSSDKRPDDVFLRFYGVLESGRSILKVYSFKKEEISTKITEKDDGTFEIVAIRKKVSAPPVSSACTISVWIKTEEKGKSNTLETYIGGAGSGLES